MTNEISIDQIKVSAAELAHHTLAAGQYHVEDTNDILKRTEDGVKYFVYYLTIGQQANVAYAVNKFLDGSLDKLDVCGVSRPKGFIATKSAWTIARDIIARAIIIIDEVNEAELEAAEAEFLRTKANRPSHPRALASRN